MKTFKFKKGAYIVNREYLTDTRIDSYQYELYIGENKKDVKKQYDKEHKHHLNKNGLESTVQDVTILRICQVLEKLKYMPKTHYFNLQDTTVLNWLEKEFKIILKESQQSKYNKNKELKRRSENATKSNNWWNI